MQSESVWQTTWSHGIIELWQTEPEFADVPGQVEKSIAKGALKRHVMFEPQCAERSQGHASSRFGHEAWHVEVGTQHVWVLSHAFIPHITLLVLVAGRPVLHSDRGSAESIAESLGPIESVDTSRSCPRRHRRLAHWCCTR